MNSPIIITGASGVYEIICQATGKRYVGSSINMEARRAGHVRALRSGTHHNRYLQRTYNKHGERNFIFRVLVFCDSGELLAQEQKCLDKSKTQNRDIGFNLCPVAGSRLGTRFSEESKKRLSVSRQGKYTGKANHNYGKSQSQSVRKKISESLKGRFAGKNSPSYGRVVSEETRKKIGEAGKGRPAWNKGMTARNDPRIKKYGETQRGKTISGEQRKQISRTLTGYKHTDNAKTNMSKGQKEKAWTSSERREKVRLLGKGEARLRILQNANKKRWASIESRRQAKLRTRKRDNLGHFIRRDNCAVKD